MSKNQNKQNKQKNNTIINSSEKKDKDDNISFFFHEEECKDNFTNNANIDIDINSFLDNFEMEEKK